MDFYDDLAPLYHLMFPDWSNSIRRQGEELDSVIQSEWPGHRTVLDVSCGIGTQTLALAGRGYSVVGSDLSTREIERARREADLRGLVIDFRVGTCARPTRTTVLDMTSSFRATTRSLTY
jgi:2-polyprenyl-3-methyl-5-hydroxy-6-metoxy-1,4-benzoquinol methylase